MEKRFTSERATVSRKITGFRCDVVEDTGRECSLNPDFMMPEDEKVRKEYGVKFACCFTCHHFHPIVKVNEV